MGSNNYVLPYSSFSSVSKHLFIACLSDRDCPSNKPYCNNGICNSGNNEYKKILKGT